MTTKAIIKLSGLSFLGLALIAMIISLVLPPPKASALSGANFKAGRIIDDYVFFNKSSMSVQQIQDFLNSKVPNCDRWNSYKGTVYGTYIQAPYTCLKEYNENTTTRANNIGLFNPDGSPYQVPGGKSAAQIIWDASQAHGINPQVLIVMLQKETGIVTDTWAATWQYNRAMGYACPDSGANNSANCDTSYYGFYNQVNSAARQLRRYVTYPDSYNYKVGVSRNILYNPSTSCGTGSVYLETSATAALYNYTPYQPNAAALAVMNDSTPGGTVTCGAYGNRNFFWYFNKWFGSTIGPNYAWEIVSYSYAGGDNILVANQPERVILKAKNIGRFPWYNHGNGPVRLGTWNTPNRSTSLLGQSGGTRFATVTESVVLPNEIGTFEFDLTPSKLGTFVEAMNLVAENSEWAGWPGFSPTVKVVGAYDWNIEDVVYGNGTGLMDPGSTQLITVKARNTGGATWSKSNGPPIRLATWTPDRVSKIGTNWLSPTRVAEMNESTVAPGETAGFQFYVTVPTSGQYYEKLNLVAEGQEWFENQNLTLYLDGKTFAWQPVWASPSTGTYNVPRNTNLTLTVKVKNTGTYTWTKNGTFPIRIGTSSPVNRGSNLEDTSWLSPVRPGILIEDSVAPGAEGTFSFKVKTPATTGLKIERFNLVAEGIAWFDDPGFKVTFSVY